VTDSARSIHYSMRHRLIATISQRLFGNLTYTVRHGLLRGMKRKGGLGFVPAWLTRAHDTTPEQVFWQQLDLAGKTVWDVGAFEGLLTLHFARKAAQVVAWEPHPVTRGRLEQNIALNHLSNVRIRPVGVSDQPASVEMIVDPLMPGGASVDPLIASQTSASVQSAVSTTVDIVTLDADRTAHRLPLPDLIKIDIEGMELQALMGAVETIRTARPSLYIEMHGATPADKEARARSILEFLHTHDYHSIRHVESGRSLDGADSDVPVASRGHLYCER
jgi:FkbM family methyltransferase